MHKIFVVIPNWNGEDQIEACLDSLKIQTQEHEVIVVENGSVDRSIEILETKYPKVELIKNSKNRGFAGGVNQGIKRAIELGADYIMLFNNDAVAEQKALKTLVNYLDKNPKVGIATCKILSATGHRLDSTGDYYTVWGLPYPRGRGESELDKYDKDTEIFAASGGASLYRAELFEQIGYFDEDFFAYYEDVDLSFRAQLAGYKVAFVPSAEVYHQISATSSKIKGFATYQTMKNLPVLLSKNMPRKYIFFLRAITRGNGWAALKGDAVGTYLLFKTSSKRRHIQKSKAVSDEYIWSMFVHDLPPNANSLRSLRLKWWNLRGKK
jgi:GT2 family glycosyltransferase